MGPCGFRQQDCFLLGHLAISREQYCGEWLWPQRGTFGVKHMGVCLTMCMCACITFFCFFDHFEKMCLRMVFANTRGSWPHVPGPCRMTTDRDGNHTRNFSFSIGHI